MFEMLRNLFQRSTTTPITVATNRPARSTLTVTSASDAGILANSVSPVFMDTETTGLNQDGGDEVLEIAIVDADGTSLLDTLVHPVRNTSWPNAQAIHGISPQDVANAPTWDALLPKIAAICAGKKVVFYNAPFDTSFFPVGFFPSAACAMRRYSELSLDSVAWVKLSDAASASGYVSTGRYHRALEDALACRHIWTFGIPALEKAYPLITNPRIVATLTLETGAHIPVIFEETFPNELRFVTTKDLCKFWTKDEREEINVYRPGTLGGKGRIATLAKANNPELTERLAAAYDVKMQLKDRCDDTLLFEIELNLSQRMLRATASLETPITYSLIDDDISRCFISHPSGMCNAIGTWEEFKKVENLIALLCKEQGGRYYRSKAKGAKFAIIFSPYAQTASEVWSLQQEGYKVTSFDRAIAYFGLKELWDCPRYVTHVKSLNRNSDALE